VWFSTLSRVERAILNLTIKCVEKVRSATLAETISTIVDKILRHLMEDFMTRAERVGSEIAKKVCATGESWGNKTCSAWIHDKHFIKFLGVNALNT